MKEACNVGGTRQTRRTLPFVLIALLGVWEAPALQPLNEGGTPRSDCSTVPAVTEIKLDWRGQNLAGCWVDLLSTGSRIHRVASDCQTIFYADLPPYMERHWSILSQPPGANALITVDGNAAVLSLPLAGNYTV